MYRSLLAFLVFIVKIGLPKPERDVMTRVAVQSLSPDQRWRLIARTHNQAQNVEIARAMPATYHSFFVQVFGYRLRGEGRPAPAP